MLSDLSQLTPYQADELMAREPVQRIGYYEPYLYSHTLVLLYAARGIGKSLWLFLVAQAVAVGGRFAGRRCKPAKALVIDGEMGLDGFGGRLDRKLFSENARKLTKHLAVFSFEQCDGMIIPSLSEPKHHDFYKRMAAPYDVIIIDNLLTCCHPRDARDDETTIWRRLQPLLVEWRTKGKCVVLVHHTAKAGQQYGTILKENLMDFIVRLRDTQIVEPTREGPQELYLEVKLEKRRHLIGHFPTEELVKIVTYDDHWRTYGMEIDQERARFIANQNPRNPSQDRALADSLGISAAHYHRIKGTDFPVLSTAKQEIEDVLF